MSVSLLFKYLAYGIVLAIYGVFAWVGKASVEAYIAVLTAVITAHGATHIAGASRGNSSDDDPPPPPVPVFAPTIITQSKAAQAGFAHSLLLGLIALVLLLVILLGCATPSSQPVQTPAEVATQACPSVQTALNSLQLLDGLPSTASKDLATVTPIVDAVCAEGANVNTSNLQTLEQTALPLVINIVKASALTAADQNKIVLGISAAQIILSSVTAINTQVLPAP